MELSLRARSKSQSHNQSPPRITFMIVVNRSPKGLLLGITYRRQKCTAAVAMFLFIMIFKRAAKYVDNFRVAGTHKGGEAKPSQARQSFAFIRHQRDTNWISRPGSERIAPWAGWLAACIGALLNVSGHKCKLGACSYCIIKGGRPNSDKPPSRSPSRSRPSRRSKQRSWSRSWNGAPNPSALARARPRSDPGRDSRMRTSSLAWPGFTLARLCLAGPLCITFKTCDISTHFKVIRLPRIQAALGARSTEHGAWTSLNIAKAPASG